MTTSLLRLFLLSILIASCAHTSLRREPAETLYVSEPLSAPGRFSKSVEGPAVDVHDNLYFVHNLNRGTLGTIVQLIPHQEPQVWLELPAGVVGNSIRFDASGKMFLADYKGHRIFQIHAGTKELTSVMEHPVMNQPNDFAIGRNGSFYMSDPTWDKRKKGHLWVRSPQGEVQLLDANAGASNGIDINLDETILYYGDSISGSIYSYHLANGKVFDKKLFYKFAPDTIDGLRTDSQGNVYVARITKGSVDCVSPEGKLIRSIPLIGKEPSNLAFGGRDGRTVFVTMRDGGYIESFRAEFPGREWVLRRQK